MSKLGVLIGIITLVTVLAGCSTVPRTGVFYQQQPTQYQVNRNDTLGSISQRYNIPQQQIARANNLQSPYILQRGQWLKIPGSATYKVRQGDTLFGIAKRFNTSIAALAQVNNLKSPYPIYPGQRLKVITTSYKAGSVPRNLNRRLQKGYEPKAKSTKKSAPKTPVEKPKRLFSRPVNGKIITKYGNQGKGEKNEGINISAASGTTVKAAEKGTVAYAGNEIRGFGNLILLKHSNGWISTYAHLQNMQVKKGQTVNRGQVIGTVGSTGSVKAPQLYFELRRGKTAVNPEWYLLK